MTEIRKGQAPAPLERQEFRLQFHRSFLDPAFDAVRGALDQVEEVAWSNYHAGRKAPVTHPAGEGYADPEYKLSADWVATRERLRAAEQRQKDPSTPSRALVIIGSCLLYTSPSPRDLSTSRMPSSA